MSKKLYSPPQGESEVEFFLKNQKFLFELISSQVKSDFESFIKNQLMTKLDITKKIKIKENPHIKDIINEKFNKIKIARESNILFDPIDLLSPKQEELMIKFNKELVLEKPQKIFSCNNYDEKEIIDEIENLNLQSNDLVYPVLNQNNFKKALIVTHAANISKLIEIMVKCKGLVFDYKRIHHCSLTVVRIYCPNCIGVCKLNHPNNLSNPQILIDIQKEFHLNKEVSFKNFNHCNIEFDITLFNDVSHLNILK